MNMSRPLGPIVENWAGATRPVDVALRGNWAALRMLHASRDAAGLWAVFKDAPWVWDYLFGVPPADEVAFTDVMQAIADRRFEPCFTISGANDPAPLGYACFLNVQSEVGSVEIGNVNLSPALQQTPIATEAFFLMIDWAISNGYRRVEWKCNALNRPSRKAAQRFGFSYEGVFRNHTIVKGRSRDTAWFALTDDDWPPLRVAFKTWLSADNFDADGKQRRSLSDLTRPHLVQHDPLT